MNISEAMKGFNIYHFLYVGIKTGIFDFIHQNQNKGITSKEISDYLNLNEEYVEIWLNTGYAFNYFRYTGDKYYLHDEYVDYLLERSNVKYQGDMIRIFVEHLSSDMKLQAQYMLDGRKHRFGEHDIEFIRLISSRGILRAKTFISNYIEKHCNTAEILNSNSIICDIGCGTGSFIRTIQEAFPESKYWGIDADATSIELAKKDFSSSGIEFLSGDFTNMAFKEKFTIITMVLTLHEIQPEHRLNILKKCFDDLEIGGKIFIMEFPYPENRSEFIDPKYLLGILDQYYEMIWGTKQIGWSVQRELLEKAGFKNIQRIFLDDGMYVVISGEKATRP